jgi:hypothetical protein
MRRRRLLLGTLVAVALVAPPLTGAGFKAAQASGIIPAGSDPVCVLLPALIAAFLSSTFVAGQRIPDSWSVGSQESVALLAATGWLVFQWLLFELFFGLGL